MYPTLRLEKACYRRKGFKREDPSARAEAAGVQPFRRLFVTDFKHRLTYLVDTGAALSVLPRRHSRAKTPADYKLYAANGTSISTYGEERRRLDLGLRRNFVWDLVIADVSQPILGADFLSHYNILVDLCRRRLVDGVTGLTVTGRATPAATLGISGIPVSLPYKHLLQRYPNLMRPSPSYKSKL